MAMKPVAKKALLALGVVYALTVLMMVVSAHLAGLTEAEKRYVAEIRQAVNSVVEQLNQRATEEAFEDEPPIGEEIEVASAITEGMAEEMWREYFAPRGPIIGFNYTLLLQILNFGVLVLFMYGFLWEPALNFLDERKAAVAEGIQSAQEDRQQARQAREEAEQKRREALEERNDARTKATREAQKVRDDIVRNAREESARMVESTRQELEAAVEQAKEALRAEIADLTCDVAAKVIERDIKPEDHRSFVDQFIEDLDKEKAEV